MLLLEGKYKKGQGSKRMSALYSINQASPKLHDPDAAIGGGSGRYAAPHGEARKMLNHSQLLTNIGELEPDRIDG